MGKKAKGQDFFGKLERIDPKDQPKSGRRDFIKNSLKLFAAGSIGGKFLYDWGNDLYKEYILDKIYELKSHVHISQTTGMKYFKDFLASGQDFFLPAQRDVCGIILEGKYITVAHLTNWKDGRDKNMGEYKILNQKVELYGKELDELVLDSENDIAIYKIPAELDLPNFPCKPSTEISLGDETYIIGNPGLRGFNIRKGSISDLDGANGIEKYLNLGKKGSFFGVDFVAAGGDSGCPVVNSNFELLGLGSYVIKGGLFPYFKRISEFLKEIEKLNEKKKQKPNCE